MVEYHRDYGNGIAILTNYTLSVRLKKELKVLARLWKIKKPRAFGLSWERGEKLLRVVFVKFMVLF